MSSNNQPQVVFAPRNHGPKNLTILLGIFGGLVLLGIIIVLAIVSLLFGPRLKTKTTIASYLQDKYGTSINFIDTGEGGGGGIDINHYFTYYTTPDLGNRSFEVRYSRDKKSGQVTVHCDGYTEAKFADKLENLFSDVLHGLGYTDFVATVTTPSGCSQVTPTDDFYTYLRDKKADIFVQIVIQNNPNRPVDKVALADALISRMKELNLPQKNTTISNTFTRIEVLNDRCSYLDPLYTCPKSGYIESFWVTLEGYKDVPNY